ncbi:MAG: hypothetical protein AMXMBFR82_39590 [Candidatus Hydrogenedentota bacterium]
MNRTDSANASRSVSKVLIPRLQKRLPVTQDHILQHIYLVTTKTSRPGQPNRVQLKLGCRPIPTNMNMGRLIPFVGKEEEPIGAYAFDGWHKAIIPKWNPQIPMCVRNAAIRSCPFLNVSPSFARTEMPFPDEL